jgi:adenylate cyclase
VSDARTPRSAGGKPALTPTLTRGTEEGAVVFTDIVGFTEFCALRGDDEAVALLALQDRLVHDALPPGARIVKELGDGLLLWFPHAGESVSTCLDLQACFERESQEPFVPLWVRMGLHWGTPARRGDDLVGHDINVAARIVDVAGPGEVLVSEALHAQIATTIEDVRFDELGPVVMKGVPEPVRLYRALTVRQHQPT